MVVRGIIRHDGGIGVQKFGISSWERYPLDSGCDLSSIPSALRDSDGLGLLISGMTVLEILCVPQKTSYTAGRGGSPHCRVGEIR